MSMPSVSELREALHYDPDTGEMTWLKTYGYRGSAGKPAGSKNGKGYIQFRIRGVAIPAHRAAIAMHTGQWPEASVDHINGVRDDNRFCNLRVVDHPTNMQNSKMWSHNKSGQSGVYFDKSKGKWRAQISKNGKLIQLGRFTHKEDAIAARKSAEVKYGFHPNHGR